MRQLAEVSLDYVVLVRTALARVERLSDEIEAPTVTRVKLCREAWRDYGAGLLAERKMMPNDKAFGAWIKANGLNTGRAVRAGVRADAMWLAEHWERFTTVVNLKNHHPSGIRQECRNAGHEWATAKRRKDGVAKATKTKRLGWMEAAFHYLEKADFASNTILHNNKEEIEKELGHSIPKYVSSTNPEVIAIGEAVRRWSEKRNLKRPKEILDLLSDEIKTFPKQWQTKFDAIVKRQISALEADFDKRVEAKAIEMAEKETEKFRRFYMLSKQEADEAKAEYTRLAKKLPGIMSKDEYRLVLSCLHSDKLQQLPVSEQAWYTEAFTIMRRLGESVKW